MGSTQIPCCSPQPACTEPVPFRTYCFLRLFPVFVGVVCAEGQRPTMLLTTASVHSGASGGAVVSAEGWLLGLVTSNAR